jgi:hypothetical protein
MPLLLLLLLPLFSIILLVLAIYPRYVVTPGFPFFIKRSVEPEDFVTPPDDDKELLLSFARVARHWRRSCTGRFSSSASPWRAASFISRFSFSSRPAGSSIPFRPKATHRERCAAARLRLVARRNAFLLSRRRC